MKAMSLLSVLLLWTGAAQAQSAVEHCPELPADGGLAWEVVNGAEFVYCKAVRLSDGSQVFSVNLARESSFRPTRTLRDGDSVIDGHEVRWYRGEVATRRTVEVREALVELGRRSTAHIVVRAESGPELAQNRRLAEGMRFRPTSVGGD